MRSRELDGKKCHENDPTAVYFGCKNKLNKQDKFDEFISPDEGLFERNM